MITQLKVLLERQEYLALYQAAKSDLRNPSDQARHILRERLQELGLLGADIREAAINGQREPAGGQAEAAA